MPVSIVTNEDNMEFMARYPEKFFDLAIVDPPYFEGPNKPGYYGKGVSSLGVQRAKHYTEVSTWEIPGKEYFDELLRVSKNQVIWGANHFSGTFNSSSSCWIVWDKVNGSSTFADAELAYTSFDGAVRVFRYMWNGMHQGSFGGDPSKKEKRIHPTQKPVKLYKWVLQHYAKQGDKILDTHLGSQSSRIAAYDNDFDFYGCELDPVHYEAGCKRFEQHIQQLVLF